MANLLRTTYLQIQQISLLTCKEHFLTISSKYNHYSKRYRANKVLVQYFSIFGILTNLLLTTYLQIQQSSFLTYKEHFLNISSKANQYPKRYRANNVLVQYFSIFGILANLLRTTYLQIQQISLLTSKEHFLTISSKYNHYSKRYRANNVLVQYFSIFGILTNLLRTTYLQIQ